MAADPCLEHRDLVVQAGPLRGGREVVWPGHELPPPPGLPAGELPDPGIGGGQWAGRWGWGKGDEWSVAGEMVAEEPDSG